MFKFFETLVDPYTIYPETDEPPTKLWPFLREYSQPFMIVFVMAAIMSVVVAAIEVGLIYYMGRIVDLMGESPAAFWDSHRSEVDCKHVKGRLCGAHQGARQQPHEGVGPVSLESAGHDSEGTTSREGTHQGHGECLAGNSDGRRQRLDGVP